MSREQMADVVRLALLAEIQRQHNDPATASTFTLSDRSGNNTPLDFTGLAAAAVDAVLEATTPDEVWEWKNQ